MKTRPPSKHVVALADGCHEPDSAALARVLGPSHRLFAILIEQLQRAHPTVVPEWKFSTISGWHQIYMCKARRLFYLVPERRDFRLSIILGDRAIDALRQGPCAGQMGPLLAEAKRYPEGTAFRFRSADAEPGLIAAMLEAKLAF